MLEVNNIEVVFDDFFLILKGISLEVPDGAIIAFLGSNGAGKTVTLKAIMGLLSLENGEVTDGDIVFDGRSILRESPAEIVKRGVVLVPEGRGIFDKLTTEENLLLGAYQKADRLEVKKSYEKVLDYFPAVKRLLKTPAGFLSGGEQQMVAIGRALMAGPKLMLLDEPSLGLAPLLVGGIFEIITQINRERKTAVLLVEQNANIALKIAQYGYIMENGKIVMDDKCEKLLKNQDVREFYLGIREGDNRMSYHDVKHYKRRKRWLS